LVLLKSTMQKNFLANLILIILLNLLIKPFFILGVDAEVQNRVGEVVYGNYFSLLNFSFLLNILLDLGTTNYNTRSIAQHPHLIEKQFYKIIGLRFSLFFLYAAFTLMFGLVVGYDKSQFYVLLILMINQFFIAFIQFVRSNFGGLHLFKTDAFISVLDRTMLIVFCSVLLWTDLFSNEFEIIYFVYAQTLAYALTALIAFGLLYKKVGKIKLTLKRNFSLVIVKQSFPYALLILLMMMYSRIDAVMLERLLPDGATQAGIYAQGFRYLDAVNMFALLFAGLLLPVFARMIKQKNNELELVINQAFRLLIGTSIVVGVVAYLFSTDLLSLRYINTNNESAATFGWLILSFIPVSVTYIFGTLLTANGSLKALNQMAIIGVVVNLLLNLLLINLWKAQGAALATLITQLLTALIQFILAHRILKLKINFRLLLSILVLLISIPAFYYIVNVYIESTTILFIMVCIAAIFMLLVLQFYRLNDIKGIWNKSQTK